MNTLQRLLSNTLMAYAANLVVKASNALIFIALARQLGPTEAGTFNLGITYFTIALALSAVGLNELLIREAAPRRRESSRYFSNYLAMRMLFAVLTYAVILLLLSTILPYSATTAQVIRILTLALFPEAAFMLCQAVFVAHERLALPTLAALVSSAIKLGGGFWLLSQGADVVTIAWVVPLGSFIGLLVFLPGLYWLFRSSGQPLLSRIDLHFSRDQLRQAPGFVMISFFSTIDFQLDAFLISIMLSETQLGWYGAAQTIVLGFWMLAGAVRTALYPVMARYAEAEPDKLPWIYNQANHYLLLLSLPIVAGVSLLAEPIIALVYGDGFAPAVPVLQVMIWAVLFAFLMVPNARLILILHRQREAGWLTGTGMVTNVVFNLALIPVLGIVGAGLARTAATLVFYLSLYWFVQRYLLRSSLLPQLFRPILATVIMALVVYPLRDLMLFIPVMVGAGVYLGAIVVLGAFSAEDRAFLKQHLFRISRKSQTKPT
ncbi:MAG: flippase [Anaerolineae bacterium]|nr:flippase [Anaerolineae bacterium]